MMKSMQGFFKSAGLLLVVLSQSTNGNIFGTALARMRRITVPSRVRRTATPPSMQLDFAFSGDWPPPLDAVHVFDVSIGGKEKSRLALTQVSEEKKAVLALWKFAYAYEAGGGEERLARAKSELQAEFSLAEESYIFGAYLNGIDGDEHGLVLVRFESDTRIVGEPRIMNIDTVMVSPRLPLQSRAVLQGAMVQSLRMIGEANGMTVRLLASSEI